MKRRDPLELAHDLIELTLLAGVLVALVWLVARGHHPLELFAKHGGMEPSSSVVGVGY